MRTYCQATQDAADELQLFALNTSSLYSRLLESQRRVRFLLEKYPNANPEDFALCYSVFYADARRAYHDEIGKNFKPAVINCAKQMQACEDVAELRSTPTAFDWITEDAIARTY